MRLLLIQQRDAGRRNGRRKRFEKGVDVREILIRDDLRRIRRHLARGRADVTKNRRERNRGRADAWPRARTRSLTTVAFITAVRSEKTLAVFGVSRKRFATSLSGSHGFQESENVGEILIGRGSNRNRRHLASRLPDVTDHRRKLHERRSDLRSEGCALALRAVAGGASSTREDALAVVHISGGFRGGRSLSASNSAGQQRASHCRADCKTRESLNHHCLAR